MLKGSTDGGVFVCGDKAELAASLIFLGSWKDRQEAPKRRRWVGDGAWQDLRGQRDSREARRERGVELWLQKG